VALDDGSMANGGRRIAGLRSVALDDGSMANDGRQHRWASSVAIGSVAGWAVSAMAMHHARVQGGPELSRKASMFHFENWDVFKAALRLREIAEELSKRLPKGHSNELRPLRESASSVVLNLAEGARQRTPGRAADHYGVARGSASESYGTFLILQQSFSDEPLISEGKLLCSRIAAMTTNMIRKKEDDMRSA
jgi:four helix bundle protein